MITSVFTGTEEMYKKKKKFTTLNFNSVLSVK